MNTYKFISKGLATAILSCTLLSSCSDYLDVNDNPNYPTTATPAVLLPSACASTVAIYGFYGSLIGTMWLQHTTQGNTTNQYNTLCNYSVTANSYNSFFTNAYANTLPDLNDIITQSEESGDWDYWVIAKVLTAYNYHMLTDIYEDIPFTEALDMDNKYPSYDDSKTVVYPGILSLLDEAIAKETDAKATQSAYIDTYDMFLEGDIDAWVGFAKNLKLKVLMRDFESNQSAIKSLLDAGGLYESDVAFTKFENATDKGNPLYEYNIRQLNTLENIRACHTLVEYLLANDDPRIVNFYETTSASRTDDTGTVPVYEGLPCGTKPATSVIALRESSRYLQSYDDPVYLMNEAEIYFLEAEAYARLGDTANAKAKYESGVRAAFNRWDNTAGLADSFIADGGAYAFDSSSEEAMLKCIMTQKWVAYAKANSLDGVFDRNRTGIPAISSAATVRVSNKAGVRTLTDGYELGSLVAPGSTVLQPTDFPRRMLVPNVSAQYNPNAPTTKELYEPMWWQVERGK